MYETILLPTDGSEGTAETLRHGLEIARNHGATVHALYVVDRRPYLAAPDDTKDEVRAGLEEEGDRAVGEVVDRAEDAGVAAVAAVRDGIPYKDILEYAEEHGVDLIVMGTHGRTGRDRLATLGSVTERVVDNAPCPVLVVRIGEE